MILHNLFYAQGSSINDTDKNLVIRISFYTSNINTSRVYHTRFACKSIKNGKNGKTALFSGNLPYFESSFKLTHTIYRALQQDKNEKRIE